MELGEDTVSENCEMALKKLWNWEMRQKKLWNCELKKVCELWKWVERYWELWNGGIISCELWIQKPCELWNHNSWAKNCEMLLFLNVSFGILHVAYYDSK